MKLSAEEAQLAYAHLHMKGRPTVNPSPSGHPAPVSPQLMTRVIERIAETPEVSPARVAEALNILGGSLPTAEAIAERILWRAYADALR